jgi:hypothetical protein
MSLYDDLESGWRLDTNAIDFKGSNDGTINGATFDDAVKILGSGSSFYDNSNDYISFPTFPDIGSQSIAISLWFKSTDATASHLISKGTGGDYSWQIDMGFQGPGTGRVRFVLFNTVSGVYLVATSVNSLNDDAWHNVIPVYDQSAPSIKLYVDGVYEATATVPVGTFNSSTVAPMQFGRRADLAGAYGGWLDEVNTFRRILTDGGISLGQVAGGEIAELWNGGAGIELGAVIGGNRRRKMMQLLMK